MSEITYSQTNGSYITTENGKHMGLISPPTGHEDEAPLPDGFNWYVSFTTRDGGLGAAITATLDEAKAVMEVGVLMTYDEWKNSRIVASSHAATPR